MRPKLGNRAEEIVEMFLERGIFESQTQVIETALMVLLDKQLEEESKIKDGFTTIDDEITEIQLNNDSTPYNSRVS